MASKKSLSFLIVLVCLSLALATPLASAMDVDNCGKYNQGTRTMQIKNACPFGLDWFADDVAEITLVTPEHVRVAPGYNLVQEWHFNSNQSYEEAVKSLESFDINSDKNRTDSSKWKKIKKDYDLKLKKITINETTLEEVVSWVPIENNKDLPSGEFNIGVFTNVELGDYIELIPTLMGVEIEEWAYFSADIEVGMMSYYNLDELSGEVLDETGNFNLTNYGATPGVQGVSNTAYDFEYDDDIDSINGTNIDPDNYNAGLSYNAWIKVESFPAGKQQNIVFVQDDGSWGSTYAIVKDNGALHTRFGCGVSTCAHDNIEPGIITEGTWHMVTITHDTSFDKVYVDGNLIRNDSSGTLTNNRDTFFIGNNEANSTTFDGIIDEVGIWNRTLNSTEIALLYTSAPVPPVVTLNSPVDYYNLTTSTITFNGTAYDDVNLTNVSLILNGVSNETNSSGLNNSEYLFARTLEDGNYNWTYEACNSFSLCTSSTLRYLTVDTTNPTINFTVPTTDTGNYVQDSIEANVTATDITLDTITIYLSNLTGLINSTSSSSSPLFINFTDLEDGTYYLNSTANDTFGNTNSTETRTIALESTGWGGVGFIGDEYQLMIVADSVTGATGDIVITQADSNVFKINTTNSDDEVSRALIMEWLFSDGRANSTYMPGVTNVYVNDEDDDEMRGYKLSWSWSSTGAVSSGGTFSNTASNNVSSWSSVSVTHGGGGGTALTKWEVPTGTILNQISATGGSSASSDEMGTDLSADEKVNPATWSFTGDGGGAGSNGGATAIILCKDDVNVTSGTATRLDYYVDGSFPIMEYSEKKVVLNSPLYNYTSPVAEVTFNVTAIVVGGITLTNLSLWTNETGSWALRNTTIVTGLTNTTTWERTIVDGTSWNVQACTSGGGCGFAIANRTVFTDFLAPVINITYPEASVDYGVPGENISLNWTVSDSGALASCWYDYNGTNTTVTCTDQNTSFIFESGNQTITFYANDSVGNEANFTRSWIYKIFGNLEIYNLTTYETATESFRINISSDGAQTVTANLSYNGTIYPATKVGNNSEMEFYVNFGGMPEISTPTATNHSFFWEIYYGTQNINTTANNQSVGRTVFGLCNATLTVPYINFTFEDEETTISTNATIDTSTWHYYLGDGTVNKSLLYSTTSANESYGFCLTPGSKTIHSSVELQYSNTGYPQRRWTTSGDLTNTTLNQKLYMLSSADGTYSVYQVQNTVASGISGVAVEVERQFSGVWTLVEEGETDSAGAVTFWLNPDYDHRLTFTKSGYASVQITVRPSSSTYTVVMGTGEEAATYNSTSEGLSWSVYPGLGKVLLPNTTQTFLFNITANLSNIISCKMEIVNNNSISLGTTTGCSPQGGNLSLAIPLGENRSVRAIYSVNIGGGYFILDADAYWVVMTTNIPERGTIVSFFKYMRELNEFGNDANRQEYSRIVLFFLMLSIILGSICYTTGWDFSTAGGAMGLLTFLVILGSYGGFLTVSYTGGNAWMDQYVVALITSLLTGGYILNKFAREA